MHDPLVVAHEIRRPWPKREKMYDAKPGQPRWRIRLHHDCGEQCGDQQAKHAARNVFPWWRPGSYSVFWTLAGKGIYWPAMIVIWHVEPGGRDSGEVCKHYRRTQRPDGTWETTVLRGWKWHVHHWRIQVPPLQHLRRRLLTRCEWCGGRQAKGDAVNLSHSWGRDRGRWWQGERGLYHHDCSSVAGAHLACVCENPVCGETDSKGRPYGHCARCGKQRTFGRTEAYVERQRILAAVPKGQRDKSAYDRICAMYAAERESEAASGEEASDRANAPDAGAVRWEAVVIGVFTAAIFIGLAIAGVFR